MGWLTGIGAAIGLINKNETASELAKDVSSGLDMMFYTKEEQAIDKSKMTVQATESWLRMVEAMKDTEAVRSVTRRFLALFIVFNLFCMIWLSVWFEVGSYIGSKEIVQPVASSTTSAGYSLTPITTTILDIADKFSLGWVFCTIIVFYFGPQLVQIMKGKKK